MIAAPEFESKSDRILHSIQETCVSLRRVSTVVLILSVLTSRCSAGMPGALPEDIETVLRLNEEPHRRLQAISFFLLGIAAAAVALRFAWNSLQQDFDRLPRMSCPRALVFVLLTGSVFTVVLTMISGARELMTPGAWKRSGVTYELRDAAEPTTNPVTGDPE